MTCKEQSWCTRSSSRSQPLPNLGRGSTDTCRDGQGENEPTDEWNESDELKDDGADNRPADPSAKLVTSPNDIKYPTLVAVLET